jgi:hypothetical protein
MLVAIVPQVDVQAHGGQIRAGQREHRVVELEADGPTLELGGQRAGADPGRDGVRVPQRRARLGAGRVVGGGLGAGVFAELAALTRRVCG